MMILLRWLHREAHIGCAGRQRHTHPIHPEQLCSYELGGTVTDLSAFFERAEKN